MENIAFSEQVIAATMAGRDPDSSTRAFRNRVLESPGWIQNGLAVIEGIPVAEAEVATNYAIAISSILGQLLPQDGAGQTVREVKYRGVKLGEGATGRYSDSRDGGQFHTDGPHRPDTSPDWFALLCIRQAESGGGLILVPTEQIIQGLKATSFQVLQKPFLFDQREDGARPVPRPVLEQGANGAWYVNYLREYIELGHKHPLGRPLSPQQTEALDDFDEQVAAAVAAADRIEVKLAPGQFALIDNRRLLHGRTAFGDDPSDRDRLMLRTWIRSGGQAPESVGMDSSMAGVASDR